LRLLLQAVVSDRRCGVGRLGDVARIQLIVPVTLRCAPVVCVTVQTGASGAQKLSSALDEMAPGPTTLGSDARSEKRFR